MKMRRAASVVLAFFLAVLATLAYMALVGEITGLGQMSALYVFGGLSASGLLLPLWCLGFLALNALQGRRQPPPPRSPLKRAALGTVSLVLMAAGALSALLIHHGGVCMTQRAEAARANFSCGQVRLLETVCARLLADSGQGTMESLLTPPAAGEGNPAAPLDWNTALPELLRKGNAADLPLDPQVLARLAPGYPEAFVDARRWWRPLFSPPLPPDALLDAWERPFQFAPPDQPEGAVTVTSPGPDGVLSKDDIGRDFLPVMDQDIVAHTFYDAAPINRTPFGRLYTLLTGGKWTSKNENILHNE